MKSTVHKSGFTIVELLIVIVVIGILAAITLISYSGISNRAKVAVIQSDLTNAEKMLGIDNATKDNYPATLAAANNGQGLKSSVGTTFQYTYNASDNSYCLSATNSNVAYYVTSTSNAFMSGVCSGQTAPGGASSIALQTVTSSSCPSSQTQAVDARDSHSYWIRKLSDGKCWMLTNLAYAGGGINTYGDTKTLTLVTVGSNNSYTTPTYVVPSSGANVTTDPTSPSASTTGMGQYGYLYNWCAAMGSQTSTSACANASTPAPNISLSVCPAGWRLPTGSEYVSLNTAINGGSTSSDAGLRSTWLGQYSGQWTSSFSQGTYGSYWESDQFNTSNGYIFLFYSDTVYLSTSGLSKVYGTAVRCVAI